MGLVLLVRRLSISILCGIFSVGTAIVPSGSAAKAAAAPTSNVSDLQKVELGVQTLQTWYDWRTGLWRTTNWWNAANALTMLVNYSVLSGSTAYQPAIENTYNVHAQSGFLNYYYDDEGWWALAWMDAYDWTQNPDYLNMSGSLFDDMTPC